MIRVAICDDLPEQVKLIKEAVTSYFEDNKETFLVDTFESAMAFLDEFEEKGCYDIVLLDICMPGIMGMDVAAELRKSKNCNVEIVFLSTSDEFAVEAFAVGASHYLLKPFTQTEFNKAMDRVMNTIRQYHSGKILFHLVGGGIQVEEVRNIIFIESKGHIQQVYTVGHGILETRQSLVNLTSTLERTAPNQFISPGKGYVVNQALIHVIKSEYIELKGYRIPLSKRKYRQFQEEYLKYIFNANS